MIKACVVLLGLSIIYIVLAYVIESAVGILLLIIVYVRNGNKPLHWRFSKIEAKNLLGQGWIKSISGFFAEMSLRVDQVMLRWYKGTVDVGMTLLQPDYLKYGIYPCSNCAIVLSKIDAAKK